MIKNNNKDHPVDIRSFSATIEKIMNKLKTIPLRNYKHYSSFLLLGQYQFDILRQIYVNTNDEVGPLNFYLKRGARSEIIFEIYDKDTKK